MHREPYFIFHFYFLPFDISTYFFNNLVGYQFYVSKLLDLLKNQREKYIVHQSEQELERDKYDMLPRLQRLVLRSLKNLGSFCTGMDFIPLPCLEELVVEECPQLKPFIIPLFATSKRFYLKVLSLPCTDLMNSTHIYILRRGFKVVRSTLINDSY